MFIEPLERPSLSRRKKVAAVAATFILFFLIILYNETPMSKGKPIFYIPSSSLEAVAQTLLENGYELNTIDYLTMSLVTLPEEGWYRIQRSVTGRYLFFKNLHKKKLKALHVKVYAGETKQEIFRRLSKALMLDEAKLDGNYTALARFEEGNILANDYLLPRSIDEETVIRFLLGRSDAIFNRFAQEHFGNSVEGEKLKNALIIASIIQRESNDPKEMPAISSVIHNRLKKGMRLQMDGTLNYGRYSRTIVTPERIRNDNSPYNTYKHYGLIPSPLGSVSMDALKAAVSPKESDYLFFVLNEKGGHVFSGTYQDHLQNVKLFKTYLRKRNEAKKQLTAASRPDKTAHRETPKAQKKTPPKVTPKPTPVTPKPKAPPAKTAKTSSIKTPPARTTAEKTSKPKPSQAKPSDTAQASPSKSSSPILIQKKPHKPDIKALFQKIDADTADNSNH
jgi:UPF0755 protein